jgi:hypothetical protein
MKKLLCLGVLILVMTGPARADDAGVIVDVRDPLRGITFYSVQLSTDTLIELQIGPGRFSTEDVMTLGVSALMFDENARPDEYVLWLRHDGPARWLTDVTTLPLKIAGVAEPLTPTPLHVLRQDQGKDAGPFVEKLEFALTPEQFEEMLESESLTLQLSTLLGTVEKVLSEAERDAMRGFQQDAIQRHQRARTGLAALQ